MDSLGFTKDEKHSIFCIVSGIIQLGNITFSAALIKGKDGGTTPALCLASHVYNSN